MNITDQNFGQLLKKDHKCLSNARQPGKLVCDLATFRRPFYPPRLSAYMYSLRFRHNSAGHNSRLGSEQTQAALVPIIHLCYFPTSRITLLAFT